MYIERWTIDEILDDVVRVLRAAIRSPEAAASVEALVGGTTTAGDAEEQAETEPEPMKSDAVEVARAAAMMVEAQPSDAWQPEIETLLDAGLVGEFLVAGARRTARPGLPAREAIRENDVYWLVLAGAPGQAPIAVNGRRIGFDDTAAFLAEWAAAGAEVWDVTAAARQAAKRLYAEAIEAAPDGPGSPRG